MKNIELKQIVTCAGLILAALLPRASAAQAYPAKTVRLVVPFPAGGGVDVTARILAQQGYFVVASSVDAATAFVNNEIPRWA